jgi:tetraacyldisaccharide 4'-kinase
VHLLDDGFQHRGLARAVDVVLVTEEDLEDALLPAGNRREPLAALGRADVVVLREEERERVEARVRGLMREGAVVWSVRRELRLPSPDGAMCAGPRPVAFCGIARPEGFLKMLAEAGCRFVQSVGFGNHRAYGTGDVEQLLQVARAGNATGFLTTEKDAAKLSEAMLERLRSVGPVCVVTLDAKFLDEADVMREFEARIR